MKANKVTLKITVECLHTDCLPSLVEEARDQISKENFTGSLTKSDGDKISWEISQTEVDF